MNVEIAPNGHLQIDDARITFRNFAGAEKEFNREGDRNFSWVIDDQDLANRLIEDGWNVRIRPPRDEGGEPFIHLPVKVQFGTPFPLTIKLVRPGMKPLELDEDSVKCLDHMDIERIDMDIRPHDWVINEGKPSEKRGRSAKLQTMYVTQSVNRFAERYEFPVDEEPPFDMDEMAYNRR